MTARFQRSLWGCLLALGLTVPGGAFAVVITFQATDLAQAPGATDRWQYSYGVTGSFVGLGGFNVLFSPNLYSKLEPSAPQVIGDWIVVTTEPNPDPNILADGLYRATKLAADPSLAVVFTVSFDWLGSGSPDAQTLEVFDESGFLPIQIDLTRIEGQVPLPSTLGLLGLGLLALRARKAVTRTN